MQQTHQKLSGLSQNEVNSRTLEEQVNLTAEKYTPSYARIIWRNIASYYNLVIISAFILLMIVRGSVSSLISISPVFMNIVISLFQEIRTKIALDKLERLNKRFVTVLRNGKEETVNAELIVKDEIIVLKPGDSIVVDGELLESNSIEIDESSITGESDFVAKQVGDQLISGSYCAVGTGIMIAEKIGKDSFANKLAKTARKIKLPKTPTEKKLNRVLKFLTLATIVMGPLTLISGNLQQIGISINLENLINVVASLVPQGLILCITILFAYGALNISKKYALIRQVNTVESLGHLKVLCIDKTGTITTNNLKFGAIFPQNKAKESVILRYLSEYVANTSWQNKTIVAIMNSLQKSEDVKSLKILSETPFSSARKWSSMTINNNKAIYTLVLGAPEIISKDEIILKESKELSLEGDRVLALGFSKSKRIEKGIPEDLEIISLISLEDEIREDIQATILRLKNLGITTKIISGDNLETVETIARKASIEISKAVTEDMLLNMSPEEFKTAVIECNIFARITPRMKQKIVKTIHLLGFHVGMVGDGVNDVPALKQANVGICMNSGAQIAKDVSSVILLKNTISTLPYAVIEGRDNTNRIYAVIKIYLSRILAISLLYFVDNILLIPFGLNLLQSSWSGIITVSIPVYLISFKIINARAFTDFKSNVIHSSINIGIILGVAMIISQIIGLKLFKINIELVNLNLMLFAGIYSMYIMYEVLVTGKALIENLKNWRISLIFALLTLVNGVGAYYVSGITLVKLGTNFGVVDLVLIVLFSIFTIRLTHKLNNAILN